MGYSAQLQGFSLTLYSREVPRLMVLEPRQEEVEAEPLAQSITGDVTGEMAFAGLGRAEDFPAGGLAGKVALMDRGVIRFSDKGDNAARQGAVAAVIVNNRSGPLFGALVGPGPIPVVGVSQEDGEVLKRLAQQGGARVRVQVKEEQFTSQNVIAEKPGSGQGVVIIGGHYDSVPGVAGAGDNASGMAVVLTVARETAGRQYPFTLRFMGFGAEELGLIGSSRYVESLSAEERGRIRAVLNLDVVGGPVSLAVGGDGQLGSRMRELASGLGLSLGTAPGDTGSDHLPFIRAGIPAVIITTPDYDVIHTPQDVPERVSPESLGKAVALVLAFLEAMARKGAR
jgi:aminopeptidase YwaD